ncbi:MAG: benzoate/H(+) symporter BenE family transporter, partial [Pseudomonadota bacterium]
LWRRMPISVAWSTPGAALLAVSTAPAGGFAEAVGAFVIAAVCAIVASLWRPLGRLIEQIPPSIAQAMLAGILMPLCLVPVHAIAELPVYGVPIALTWLITGQMNRIAAVPAAVLVAVGMIAYQEDLSALATADLITRPVIVVPEFSVSATIGIAIPLFIVTLASQNIPGIAVLNGFGYRPAPQPLFRVTGFFSLVAAPVGGHAINLAAITAAICANEDADPNPARRYWSTVVAGVVYILFGLAASMTVAFAALAPALAIGAVAGLALIGALAGAIAGAVADAEARVPAIITFLIAASGVSIAGISGAIWGLCAGLLLYFLQRVKN